MDKEEKQFLEISSRSYTEYCNCDYCLEIKPMHGSFYYLKFLNSNIFICLIYLENRKKIIKYYKGGCPFAVGSRPIQLEDALDLLPEDILTQVLFDLSLFR